MVALEPRSWAGSARSRPSEPSTPGLVRRGPPPAGRSIRSRRGPARPGHPDGSSGLRPRMTAEEDAPLSCHGATAAGRSPRFLSWLAPTGPSSRCLVTARLDRAIRPSGWSALRPTMTGPAPRVPFPCPHHARAERAVRTATVAPLAQASTHRSPSRPGPVGTVPPAFSVMARLDRAIQPDPRVFARG